MKNSNPFLALVFAITILPKEFIPITIKYAISLPIIFLIYVSYVSIEINKSDKNKLFSLSIYIYVFGILLSSFISDYKISSSVIYASLFILRFTIIEYLCRKISFFKILDSAVIGSSASFLFCILYDVNSRLIFKNLLTLKISGIANSRLQVFGSSPNFLGISAGIICLYILIRIINEQYELNHQEDKATFNSGYNNIFGYILLFWNFLILFLCNTRSAYLALFIALIVQVINLITRKKFFQNKFNKFYIAFMGILLFDFKRIYKFINKFIILLDDKYRGASTGLTGRINIWKENLNIIGPIGYGYRPGKIIDNNFIYSSYMAGTFFALPLYIYYLYFTFKNYIDLFNRELNFLQRNEKSIKVSLSIFIITHLILDQQTIGQTSLISFIFVILPIASLKGKDRSPLFEKLFRK